MHLHQTKNHNNETINQIQFYMEKNSTHFSNASFIPHEEKDMKENTSQEIPGDAVIQNILNFSKAFRIKKSATIGIVELVLN